MMKERIKKMPTIDMIATENRIRDLRDDRGLRTADIIQAVFGFGTPQAIFKWMRGDTWFRITLVRHLWRMTGL